MSVRDLSLPRVGAALLGIVEIEGGDDILTFTAPPGVAPLTEAQYAGLMVRVIVRGCQDGVYPNSASGRRPVSRQTRVRRRIS